MDLVDVDPKRGEAIVRRGKGGKGRLVSFGPQTGVSIDRYIRARRTHRHALSPALWLGAKGSARLGYSGLHAMLTMRANMAGISGFFPHKTRHTTASEWLKRGGSEQGLMVAAGWTSRAMLDRYTESTAADRAAEEARRLNMGEW
jgi:integrase